MILGVLSGALSTHWAMHVYVTFFCLCVCVCRSQGMSWIDNKEGGKGQLVDTHEDQMFEWTMRSHHIHTMHSQHIHTG